MTRRTIMVRVLVLLMLVLAGARAEAQVTARPVLYRLESGSSFSRGCYPPCLCAIFTTEDIRGTYRLAFDHEDPLFKWYRVENVNWVVTLGGVDTRITGSGTYRVGGEVAVLQQLTLTLKVGDEQPQAFDSGLVPGDSSFPEINIAVSVNGMVCFDTVIDIRSKPVPAADITRYKLSDASCVEGCFAPCQCAIREWPVDGGFALVPLNNATTPTRREFAVVNVKWETRFGTYQIVDEGPTSQQRMVLDLTETGSGTTSRFDSGQVPGGSAFPRIGIDLSVNGFYCFDKAFYLHASP
jgi:hypothetical protein